MNYCTSCGNKLAEGTVFCPKCGTKLGEVGTAPTNERQTTSSEGMKEQLINTYENTRELVQQSKYPDYFISAVKRPASALEESTTSYGWIQAILFAVVSTLSMYGMITGMFKIAASDFSFMSFLGIGEGIFSLVRREVVPRLFMVSLVTFLTFVLSAFIVLKFAGKSKHSFGQLLTNFGGLLSPNIVAIFVASIVTLLFATEFTVGLSAMILVFSFILCFAAYNYYLYSRISVEKIDRMYVLLLSNILLLILLFILIFIQVEPIITLLDRMGGF